jgi:dolichol kinase
MNTPHTPQTAALAAPTPPTLDADVLHASKSAGVESAWTREAVRKLIHLGMVILPAWIWWAPDAWRSPGLLLALAAVLSADVLRAVWRPWARWIEGWSRLYRRPRERVLWVGVHAMFVSAWLLSWNVSPATAVLCLSYGVFGDAAASLVGMRSGRAPRKSGQGSVACFLTCCVIGIVLLPHDPVRVVLGAGAATAFERYSGPIDDNLTIPLGTAIVLALLS